MAEIIELLKANMGNIAELVLALLVVAEIVVRLTPTVADDGAVERAGHIIKKILDWVGFPNNKKE
jgi:acetolactate synthase small subunit